MHLVQVSGLHFEISLEAFSETISERLIPFQLRDREKEQ